LHGVKIGFYRVLGCKIEKQPMMFSNTPKKVVIFKKTTGKINSVRMMKMNAPSIYTVGFCGGKPPHFYPISGDPHLIPPF
jgi:hypothetical protein